MTRPSEATPSDHRADPNEARHPIAVVAARTGLSQDVLRVWERRYHAVRPARGAGGHRAYADSDIERLRLLRSATAAGRSISQIAGLATPALAQMVQEDLAAAPDDGAASGPARPAPRDETAGAQVVDVAFSHLRALDSHQLDAGLRRAAALMGTAALLDNVVVPLLRRVGDEWHAGKLTPAQEHLASSVVEDLVAERMRALPRDPAAPRVLVATTAGERHVIGAVAVGASAAAEGWNVLFLGADLPAEDIMSAAIAAGVRVVALSVAYVGNRAQTLTELRTLGEQLPEHITLIVGGSGAASLKKELDKCGVRVVSTLAELTVELRTSAS